MSLAIPDRWPYVFSTTNLTGKLAHVSELSFLAVKTGEVLRCNAASDAALISETKPANERSPPWLTKRLREMQTSSAA